MRKGLLLALSGVLTGLALLLAGLAIDVGRWQHGLAAGDVRFQGDPAVRDPWRAPTILPARVSRRLLAVDDDLLYRRAVRLFRLGRPNANPYEIGPLSLRAQAQAELTRALRVDRDVPRRAREANLLGVLFVIGSAVANREDSPTFFEGGITSFRSSIALDPRGEEAKFNLELALLRQREDVSLRNPVRSSGTGRGRGAGAGSEGGGY